MTQPHIKVCPDPAAVAVEGVERVIAIANESIADHGSFSIALSGGSTPKAMHDLLSKPPYRDQIDWPKVQVFWGDERCVPPDHKDSNFLMAKQTLLSKVPIPGDNIHRMLGEIEPGEAAKQYGLMLKEKFGDGGLDLALLGMGDDGHTASLFPHTPALNETKHRCVSQFVEKSTTGPSWRITLTAPFLNRCRHVVILVTGSGKAERLAEVLEGPRDPQRLPIQLIDPENGELLWIADAAAVAMQG